MNLNFAIIVTLFNFVSKVSCNNKLESYKHNVYDDNDNNMASDSKEFPYVVAVLKKSTYLSTGALIDENWVLTAADSLFLLRDSTRLLRVRLGTINYRKGGVLLPVQFLQIHPFFDDAKPEYDIALIRLPKRVRSSPSLHPIRLQQTRTEIKTTHFIVTAWPFPLRKHTEELQKHKTMEVVRRRRILRVYHLHPTDPERCALEMEALDVNATDTLMCLDPQIGTLPCTRDAGAPVVVNGVLWGIASSWRPDDCDLQPGPAFATVMAAKDILSWIHSVIRGHSWTDKVQNHVLQLPDSVVYSDELEDNTI